MKLKVKFSQKYQHMHIQTAGEKPISLKKKNKPTKTPPQWCIMIPEMSKKLEPGEHSG